MRKNILKILGCLFKDLVSLEWCKKRKKKVNLQNKTFVLQFHSGWGSCKDIISCLGKGSTFSLTEMVLFSFSLFSVYFGPAFLELPKCVTIMRLLYMPYLMQAVPLGFISIYLRIKRFSLSKVSAI